MHVERGLELDEAQREGLKSGRWTFLAMVSEENRRTAGRLQVAE